MTGRSVAPTSLNASERDALLALAVCMDESPDDAPTTKKWRRQASDLSERFSAEGSGKFYIVKSSLVDQGLVTTASCAEDARKQVVGLTSDGERVLSSLANPLLEHSGVMNLV